MLQIERRQRRPVIGRLDSMRKMNEQAAEIARLEGENQVLREQLAVAQNRLNAFSRKAIAILRDLGNA